MEARGFLQCARNCVDCDRDDLVAAVCLVALIVFAAAVCLQGLLGRRAKTPEERFPGVRVIYVGGQRHRAAAASADRRSSIIVHKIATR